MHAYSEYRLAATARVLVRVRELAGVRARAREHACVRAYV
jgi:hypothetical protein